MKRRIKKDIVLILLGVAIVAIPFLLRMKEQERSNRYMKAFEEEQNEEKQNKKDHKKKDSLLLQEGVIGIIEIPSLDIKYPVFEGAGSVQLNEGIGHMTNTTELCGKGNCVLAGHNGSRRGVYFTYLCNIEAGAKVMLMNRKKEKHEYTVKEMKVVNPYDEWVTKQTEGESLTLFTCAEHGTKRFVVKCEPVNNTDQQDGEKTDRRKGGGAIGSK
ncbi:class D sortase [Roseburia sp. AM59-24XD]|uniref:class D sortase n=1 Tax=Roseburia sp. AM59-24XD TaxID=2293138 RepID=UPI000E51BE29|nr:class D sortase [Roseburia sp. AM59-24XD]RHP89073.1 class D sortase [Roseburia sp. AM59-24XD]